MKDANLIFGLVATVLGILSTIYAYQKGLKTDSKKSGEETATISQQIAHLSESLNEIKATTKETNQSISKYAERIIKLEAQQLNVERRLDEIANICKERGNSIA